MSAIRYTTNTAAVDKRGETMLYGSLLPSPTYRHRCNDDCIDFRYPAVVIRFSRDAMRLELAELAWGELSWRQLELQLRVDQCPAPDCPFHLFGTGPAACGTTQTFSNMPRVALV